MVFCSKCGKQLNPGEMFCAGCGSSTDNRNSQQTGNNFNQTVNNFMNTPDSTSEFDSNDIQSNKGMAILAYVGNFIGLPLFIIPLLAAPNSRFARFHVNQGLVLFLSTFIIAIASGITTFILFLLPVIGLLIGFLLILSICIAFFVLTILGLVNAGQGQAKELPLIGKFRILK